MPNRSAAISLQLSSCPVHIMYHPFLVASFQIPCDSNQGRSVAGPRHACPVPASPYLICPDTLPFYAGDSELFLISSIPRPITAFQIIFVSTAAFQIQIVPKRVISTSRLCSASTLPIHSAHILILAFRSVSHRCLAPLCLSASHPPSQCVRCLSHALQSLSIPWPVCAEQCPGSSSRSDSASLHSIPRALFHAAPNQFNSIFSSAVQSNTLPPLR